MSKRIFTSKGRVYKGLAVEEALLPHERPGTVLTLAEKGGDLECRLFRGYTVNLGNEPRPSINCLSGSESWGRCKANLKQKSCALVCLLCKVAVC